MRNKFSVFVVLLAVAITNCKPSASQCAALKAAMDIACKIDTDIIKSPDDFTAKINACQVATAAYALSGCTPNPVPTPTPIPPVCPPCINGYECKDPNIGCVPIPPPVCPESCPSGMECKDPAIGCVPIPLTCKNIDCQPGFTCVDLPSGSTCIPTPSPVCPSTCPEGAKTINAKTSGNGFDSTPRCNDLTYCETVTGLSGVSTCKANPEGSNFAGCDTLFLGQTCPNWYYLDQGGVWQRCLPGQRPFASCDHFDHFSEGSPYTGTCHVGDDGVPDTGFFMIPHVDTVPVKFRACDSTGSICSQPLTRNPS